MTLSEGFSHETLTLAEAKRVEFALLSLHSLVNQYIQGVLAVHSSDLGKAHHTYARAVLWRVSGRAGAQTRQGPAASIRLSAIWAHM